MALHRFSTSTKLFNILMMHGANDEENLSEDIRFSALLIEGSESIALSDEMLAPVPAVRVTLC